MPAVRAMSMVYGRAPTMTAETAPIAGRTRQAMSPVSTIVAAPESALIHWPTSRADTPR